MNEPLGQPLEELSRIWDKIDLISDNMRTDAGYGNLSQSMDNLEERINNAIQLSQQLTAKSQELETRQQLATSEPDLYHQYMGESSSSFLDSLAYHREKLRNEARSRILDFSDITGDLGNYDSNNNNLDSTPLSARYMPTGVTSKPDEDSNDEDYGTRNGLVSPVNFAPTSHFQSSNYVPANNYAAISSYDNAGGYQATTSKAPANTYSPIYSQHEPLGLSKPGNYASPLHESVMADSLEPRSGRYSGAEKSPQQKAEEAAEEEEATGNEDQEEGNEDAEESEAADESEAGDEQTQDEAASQISEDTKLDKGVQTKGGKNSKDFIDKNKKEVWKNRKGSYAVLQAKKAEQERIDDRVNAFKKKPSRRSAAQKKEGCTCKDKENEEETATEDGETPQDTPQPQDDEVQVEDVAEEDLNKTPDDEEQESQQDGDEQENYDDQQEYDEEPQEEQQPQEDITPDNALPKFIERYGSNVPLHPMDYPGHPYYNIYPHLFPYGGDPYSAPGSLGGSSLGGETPKPDSSFNNPLPPLRNPRLAGIQDLSAMLRGEERTYSHSAGAGDPRYRQGYLHQAAMYPDPYMADPYMMPPPVPGYDFMYPPYDYVIPGIPPTAMGRMGLGPNEVRRSTSQPNLNDPRIQNNRLPPLVPQKSEGQPSMNAGPVAGPGPGAGVSPVALNRSISVGPPVGGRITSAASGSNPSRAGSAVHSAALTGPVKALPRSLGPDVMSDDYVEKVIITLELFF